MLPKSEKTIIIMKLGKESNYYIFNDFHGKQSFIVCQFQVLIGFLKQQQSLKMTSAAKFWWCFKDSI